MGVLGLPRGRKLASCPMPNQRISLARCVSLATPTTSPMDAWLSDHIHDPPYPEYPPADAPMITAVIDGEEGFYNHAHLFSLAFDGNADARAAIDPPWAAKRKAAADAVAAAETAERLALMAARRAELNPPPPGCDITPMAWGATDQGTLAPLMDHVNDFFLSATHAFVCEAWCAAVLAWRNSATKLFLLRNVRERRIGDPGIVALVRDCPQMSKLALFIGEASWSGLSVQKHPLTMVGVGQIAALPKLTSLTLAATGGHDVFTMLLNTPQAVTALRALGAHTKLETLSLPWTSGNALKALAEAAAAQQSCSLRNLRVGIGITREAVVALAQVPSLRSIDLTIGAGVASVPNEAYLRTDDVLRLATSLTQLKVFRLEVDNHLHPEAGSWEPTTVLKHLAANCPQLVHIKLFSPIHRWGSHDDDDVEAEGHDVRRLRRAGGRIQGGCGQA